MEPLAGRYDRHTDWEARRAALFGCSDRRRKARTTLSLQTQRIPAAPSLVKRSFILGAPGRFWVADVYLYENGEG